MASSLYLHLAREPLLEGFFLVINSSPHSVFHQQLSWAKLPAFEHIPTAYRRARNRWLHLPIFWVRRKNLPNIVSHIKVQELNPL